MNDDAALEAEIRRLIAVAGPMPVAEYMRHCLTHPQHGYYTTRDPFGRDGDFTTAPEISQMFGELIGLWAASVWRQMGSPQSLGLVEIGPGRGTMMLDMLRAAQVVPGFRSAIVAHLVEISPALERRQRQTLNGVDAPLLWHKSVDEIPDGPLLVVANEFFDALPAHQAIKQDDGWHERTIGVDEDGNFTYLVGSDVLPRFEQTLPEDVRGADTDAIFEWRGSEVVFEIGRRLARHNGAALVIDYGHAPSACGETLQAVSQHAYADPLVTPGLVDITAHVDFQALGIAAESIGAVVQGPVSQQDFLRQLGIERRATALKAKASPAQADVIDRAVGRLISGGPDGMGRLFKVMALAHPKLGALPGFDG